MAKYLNQEGISRLLRNITEVKEYSSLQTTNKTLLGAINEIKSSGGEGGTLPEEYYPEIYKKLQVPNTLDWDAIQYEETIAEITSDDSWLTSYVSSDNDAFKEITLRAHTEGPTSDGYPLYKINNDDNKWRYYADQYEEGVEQTPEFDATEFTEIYDQDAFDAIAASFGTHLHEQTFEEKFAAEKLTAGEGIIIDNQNKINSEVFGEVLSDQWEDVGGLQPIEEFSEELNAEHFFVFSSWGSYIAVDLSTYSYIEPPYSSGESALITNFENLRLFINNVEVSDPYFYNPIYSYFGDTLLLSYENTVYKVHNIQYENSSNELYLYLEDFDAINFSLDLEYSVPFDSFMFGYSDYTWYYLDYNNPEALTLNLQDREGNYYGAYFTKKSFLYKFNDTYYICNTNGEILAFTSNDIDFSVSDEVTITGDFLTYSDLGFNFEDMEDWYLFDSYYNYPFFSGFWRRYYEDSDNAIYDQDAYYFSLNATNYGSDRQYHFVLNTETGLWEQNTDKAFLIEGGSGINVVPNRFAVNYLLFFNDHIWANYYSQYFYGTYYKVFDEDYFSPSDFSTFLHIGLKKLLKGPIPNIHLTKYPKIQVQQKMTSSSKYINILEGKTLQFNSDLVLNKDNTSNWYNLKTAIYKIGESYEIANRANFSNILSQREAICFSTHSTVYGTITFSFTQQDIDNVKVYFSRSVGSSGTTPTLNIYAVYAGIGTIKPTIQYKIISASEMGGWHNENEAGEQEDTVFAIRVGLGQHVGVEWNIAFQEAFPAEAQKTFSGFADVSFSYDDYGIYQPVLYKKMKVPEYYEEARYPNSEYATVAQKYLPYLRDINTVASMDGCVLTYANQIDSNTGEPIPNPNYIAYDDVWTDVTEKVGQPV